MMKKDGGVLKSVCGSLDQISSTYEVLNNHQLRDRFPQFTFDDSFTAVLDPDGGVLMAEKALVTLQVDPTVEFYI